MFERPHHQRIAQVLLTLDGSLLMKHNCLFGGGTAIALRYGEYRESVDMDFLVSNIDSYRQLRLITTDSHGNHGSFSEKFWVGVSDQRSSCRSIRHQDDVVSRQPTNKV